MARITPVRVPAALGLTLALAVGAVAPTPAAADATLDAAIAFIAANQQADGGFEVAGFPGFETPDAVLAIAEAGQTGDTWSPSEALAAVEAVANGTGLTGLDALDDLADGGIDAGQAAKLIVLDAVPLGLDPRDFDPSADSADPVDLVAVMDAGSNLAFNAVLYGALAQPLVGRSVPEETVAEVVEAQQANGGWNFAGDPTGTDVDPDTTGLAVQALAAADAPPLDALGRALALLGQAQRAGGGWGSPFDPDPVFNPNSTAVAVFAVASAGFDPDVRCWRDVVAPVRSAAPFVAPGDALRGLQADDGHIAGPNDEFGLNTFGTSQAVEALLRQWLPIRRIDQAACRTSPVERLYTDLLGRDGDPDGVAYFEARAAASGYGSVARSLLDSDERRMRVVQQAFDAYLHRDADEDGLAFFSGLLASGAPDQVVRALLLASEEYAAHDGGAVVGWYRDVLGREPGAEEAGFWDGVVAESGRGQAALAFLGTDEAREVLVAGAYDAVLHRAGDPDGVAYFAGVLGATRSLDAVVAALAASTEYIAGASA